MNFQRAAPLVFISLVIFTSGCGGIVDNQSVPETPQSSQEGIQSTAQISTPTGSDITSEQQTINKDTLPPAVTGNSVDSQSLVVTHQRKVDSESFIHTNTAESRFLGNNTIDYQRSVRTLSDSDQLVSEVTASDIIYNEIIYQNSSVFIKKSAPGQNNIIFSPQYGISDSDDLNIAEWTFRAGFNDVVNHSRFVITEQKRQGSRVITVLESKQVVGEQEVTESQKVKIKKWNAQISVRSDGMVRSLKLTSIWEYPNSSVWVNRSYRFKKSEKRLMPVLPGLTRPYHKPPSSALNAPTAATTTRSRTADLARFLRALSCPSTSPRGAS